MVIEEVLPFGSAQEPVQDDSGDKSSSVIDVETTLGFRGSGFVEIVRANSIRPRLKRKHGGYRCRDVACYVSTVRVEIF